MTKNSVHLLFLFMGFFGLIVWPPSIGIIAPLWILAAEYRKSGKIYEDLK